MPPVIEAFTAAHQIPDATVVADAGRSPSDANMKAVEAAGPRRTAFIGGKPVAERKALCA